MGGCRLICLLEIIYTCLPFFPLLPVISVKLHIVIIGNSLFISFGCQIREMGLSLDGRGEQKANKERKATDTKKIFQHQKTVTILYQKSHKYIKTFLIEIHRFSTHITRSKLQVELTCQAPVPLNGPESDRFPTRTRQAGWDALLPFCF